MALSGSKWIHAPNFLLASADTLEAGTNESLASEIAGYEAPGSSFGGEFMRPHSYLDAQAGWVENYYEPLLNSTAALK